MTQTLDYKAAGVDYDLVDPLKVSAQRAARDTAAHLGVHGLTEVAASRGESAYVVDLGDLYLASITECLGTKALLADAMRAVTGRTYYEGIAQDTIAMAVNDLVTVGASANHALPPASSAGGRRPATPARSPGAAVRPRRSPGW